MDGSRIREEDTPSTTDICKKPPYRGEKGQEVAKRIEKNEWRSITSPGRFFSLQVHVADT